MEKIKLKTRKITCIFNEEELKFNIDENKLKSGLNELESEAKEMFEKINRECTFKKFRTALQARFWAEVSVYMLFPLVFILAIAGFEGGYSAFGLAWFFLGFLIVYLMTVSVVFYFINAKINEYFRNYSLMIQEIITDYNIKIFIQKGVYATFRFQSCDSKGKAQDREDIKNSYSLSKENQKKIVLTGVNFRLKSTIRSNLRKFLRLKFWVEFLIKVEEKKVDFMKEEINDSSDSEEKIMIKENIAKKETNHRVISVNEDIKLEINEEEKENSGNFDKYNNKYNKEEEKYIEEEED